MIWVLLHISTKRLYRAEKAMEITSKTHQVINACRVIKMRKFGYLVWKEYILIGNRIVNRESGTGN